MGLFNKLGREVERFKRTATAAAESSEEYRCEACGSRFVADYEECPECDTAAVVAVDADDDAGAS
jgi:rubrerythrin